MDRTFTSLNWSWQSLRKREGRINCSHEWLASICVLGVVKIGFNWDWYVDEQFMRISMDQNKSAKISWNSKQWKKSGINNHLNVVPLTTFKKRCTIGLTLLEVWYLAYQFANANYKNYPAKWNQNKVAGKSWLPIFRRKYKNELYLRKPEATSRARSTRFNKSTVATFFENYKNILNRRTFHEARVWNCNETGMTTVHNPPKLLAPKGDRNTDR